MYPQYRYDHPLALHTNYPYLYPAHLPPPNTFPAQPLQSQPLPYNQSHNQIISNSNNNIQLQQQQQSDTDDDVDDDESSVVKSAASTHHNKKRSHNEINQPNNEMIEQTRAAKSKKHNEAEIRRRTRINTLLFELGELVKCNKSYKSAILRAAIERIKELESTVDKLNIQQDNNSQNNNGTSSQLSTASIKSEPATVSPILHRPHNPPFTTHTLSSAASDSLTTGDKISHTVAPVGVTHTSFDSDAYAVMPHGIDMLHTSSLALALTEMSTGRIMDCNLAFAKFLGYSRSILISPESSFLGVTHETSIRTTYQLVQALVTSLAIGKNSAMRAIKKYTTGTGQLRDAAITLWLIADKQGEYRYVACLLEPLDSPVATTSNPVAS